MTAPRRATAQHCVTWQSTWTGTVNHHAPEPLEEAQAHLAFLRDRHPITEYWLEAAALTAPDEPGQGSEPVSMAAANARRT